ncbi:MAG: serine/threonine protein phosphatase [Sphingomonadales bacterium]|nr:MAG: serine/threonine protein phosphatase [Sphingomonadales bacterium]
MLRKLFPSRGAAAPPSAGSVLPGQRIYAIGDIHGRLDLLDDLLKAIDADDATRPEAETMLLFLGDLIDRGPQSAQVVERLLDLKRARPTTRLLLGNHEEVFLTVLAGDIEALKFFCRIGGRETILSYGFSEAEYHQLDYSELLAQLLPRVPAAHRTFLESFEDLIVMGDYAFVHAGVRPSEGLDRQKASDLRWIRREFLEHRGGFEKVIVHGHTISDEVEILPHRIGLDTGAYASGLLSAMGFEGSERWLVQARGQRSGR